METLTACQAEGQRFFEEAKTLKKNGGKAEEILKLFKQAAKLGFGKAAFKAGMLIVRLTYREFRKGSSISETEELKQVEKAEKYFLMGVNKTNGKAEYILWKMYENTNIENSNKFLKNGAEQGNFPAKYDLALLYLKGLRGLEKNIPQAIKYLEEAEENRIPKAATQLIRAYLLNKNPQNIKKAIGLSIRHADVGNKTACLMAGELLLTYNAGSDEDLKKGFYYLNKVKKDCKIDVQIIIANYFYNIKTNKGAKSAIALYRKILKNPSIDDKEKSRINFKIARVYLGDFNVEILTTNLGINYLKEASKCGAANVWLRLGQQYFEKGKSHYKLAFEAFSKASNLGSLAATFQQGCCYRFGHGVEEDKTMAFKLNNIVIKEKKQQALYFAGLDYLYGQGCKVDYEKAKGYLSESKSNKANFSLGLIAKIEGDDSKALEYFEKGHEDKDIKATMHLGNMYRTGNGVLKNSELACKYYICAAERRNRQAIWNLFIIFTVGEGVEINPKKAEEYLKIIRGDYGRTK